MKILVIGASSFTGSHFCDLARSRGADVHEVSARDFRKLSAALHEPQECVVNFAALNVVAPSWQYPSDYLFTNVYTLTSIIDMLKEKPLRAFVQVSTPEVYGSTQGWVREDHPYNPSTPYAVSRAAAELMLKCYARQYGVPVLITRGCNVYGPKQQLYRFIPKLIASIKRGSRFKLEGSGSSVRAFLHVRDMCDGIWRVMESGMLGAAYHISSRELQPIEAMARHICDRMGVNFGASVEMVDERPGKDQAYMLNADRIRAELGWQDTVSIDKGIDEVIEWENSQWETLKNASMEYEHRP